MGIRGIIMEKYEQPGERLHSKVPTDKYKEAYDRIFGKKQYWYEKVLEREKDEHHTETQEDK
jgi:hypothetical protein